jgi:purine-binding chemotaxis protein CheW
MPEPAASPDRVHLTFFVGTEEYALPLDRIGQAVSHENLTPIPAAPPFVRGLAAIGSIAVPVVDLSRRFGASGRTASAAQSILAVRVTIRKRWTLMGLLIDRLGRVSTVRADEIQPPDTLAALLPAEFLRGIFERDGRFVFLMDVDRVLDADESATVAELASGEEEGAPDAQQDRVPHLAVRVAGQRCALRLSSLREALPCTRITRVPGAPAHVLGATNVRGAIVPVLDLARRYDVGTTAQQEDSRLILVQPEAGDTAAVAFLVDGIDGLVRVAPGDVDRTPPFGARFPTQLIEGMAPLADDFIPVLDGPRAVSPQAAPQENGVQKER